MKLRQVLTVLKTLSINLRTGLEIYLYNLNFLSSCYFKYFGNLILEKLEDLNNLDYITIWYLNYQFTHSDVEYYLKDFIPIFNSYYKTIFDKYEINRNCFYILDLIEFNLF